MLLWSKWKTRYGAERLKRRIDWSGPLPQHVAIMMDGNGRWATRRGLPRTAGHVAGMHAMRETIRFCHQAQLRYLTLYAFSTENWKRPKEEVDAIIRLVHEFMTERTLGELNRNQIKVSFIGDTAKFDPDTRRIMEQAVHVTRFNMGMTVNFAVNYGGRSDIVRAVKTMVTEENGSVSIDAFESRLYTSGCPNPELLIRTSGEKRLSGFLLWQSAQAELWFTDEMWPSFNEALFYQALYEYQCRKVRANS
ncbi:Ditrans,polycis-undecaprenyl-diphosphate synthase ((2E,6E)-farnesyl-diphosphate specific) [Paenibacillus solanacearum]|uniref:Isoprenyl transferase n=1 Tax=Paenibacillus solanacearum TaxID=2048548 RepID=A0A916NEH3_9BACL|nr:polyprenyl diphosphate synthase [Paenibacillus solanacearum]CAG7597211.1 Ditrans,polycis-undecaprenyl-diphosphate synthase ((2E,6E)-farnesyl-diphosphate specific) [Paenibacillus solanacearum]